MVVAERVPRRWSGNSFLSRLHAIDLAILRAASRLPHSPCSNRAVSVLSDLGRGVGWAAVCAGMSWRGARRRGWSLFETMAACWPPTAVAQGPVKAISGGVVRSTTSSTTW